MQFLFLTISREINMAIRGLCAFFINLPCIFQLGKLAYLVGIVVCLSPQKMKNL